MRTPYKRSYGSKSRPNKRATKISSIDPSRFIKIANPGASANYKSKNEFADFSMHPLLNSNLTSKGYKAPSEIQDKTITLGLEGRNVVGIANTGTGKTAAFALPILNKLMRNPSSRAIIIAPTRELAIQIDEQCRQLSKNSSITTAVLIGGLPLGRQTASLKANARLVIGTPGRIKDHIRQGNLRLDNFDMVVLDEVDRMLDMGFLPDIRSILGLLPRVHQAFFFSATLSPEISRLIETFASDPIVINVKAGETSENVHQNIIRFNGNTQKMDLLHDVLIRPDVTRVLVFGKTKHGVERLAKELKERGFKAESMHGGKSQGQRKRALDGFKDSKVKILVATDVAARGIDVKDITHVINYDQPQTYDDYIHRIGRAGRAGQPGNALTFVEISIASAPYVPRH